jgi:DNA-binding CsgD family transcriptional regulator
MSAPSRADTPAIAEALPKEWQGFLTSGEFAGTRASIRANGSEVPVDFVARLEFLDERRLAIHVALAEDGTPARTGAARSLVRLLTKRERDVIALIATGRETQEIAEALHVSPATVRTHVRNSMAKLGAHTRAQLVALVVAGDEAREAAHTEERASDRSPD